MEVLVGAQDSTGLRLVSSSNRNYSHIRSNILSVETRIVEAVVVAPMDTMQAAQLLVVDTTADTLSSNRNHRHSSSNSNSNNNNNNNNNNILIRTVRGEAIIMRASTLMQTNISRTD